ncbi:MAG: hypothetical protein WCO58_02565 [bacterium]
MSFQQYLPSKQFSKKILIIIGILLLVVLVKYVNWSSLVGSIGRKGKIQNATLKEAVFIDTDGDGVADWEESLWGTDPKKVATFNGVDDLTYISKKRESLSQNGGGDTNETDKIAQEFFSSLMVLKDSGALNDESASVLAITLADKITSDDTLPDAISKEKISSVPSTVENKKKYLKELESIVTTYEKQGAGNEVGILAYTLQNEDRNGIKDLDDVSNAYIGLGGALAKMKVPADVVELHRRFANSSIKVGIALKKLSLLYDNATVAMPGIIQYKKYNDEFTEIGSQLFALNPKNN